jgi:WD40 repeat protein
VEAFRYGHTVLGGDDGTARLWNVKTGKQLKNWDYGGRVYSVKFTPNGRHMLTASDDATAVLYDLDP